MLIGRLENQARRNGARVRADDVALAVDVLHAEGRVDGGLIGIGGGPGQIVEIEARKELVFR